MTRVTISGKVDGHQTLVFFIFYFLIFITHLSSIFFSVDAYKWMTDDQKKKYKAKEEEINAKKHTSRLDRKITFDFAGRRVVEDLSHKQEVFDEHEFLQVWPLTNFFFSVCSIIDFPF